MKFFPEHSLGLVNAWWFALFYGIAAFLLMISASADKRKKILTFPKFKNIGEGISSGGAVFIFSRGLIIYSFFIPIKIHSVNFIIGSFIYLAGLVLSVFAMHTFLNEELSSPITKGFFKITRHPIQNFIVIMWLGAGIASGNFIFIGISLLLALISYPSLKAQERFCLEKYGNLYASYMEKTPRYFFIK